MSNQCIYILSNLHMQGIKIGMTSQGVAGVKERMKSLRTTGVPGKFICEFAGIVNNSRLLEQELHRFLNAYRCENDREFFNIDPHIVKFLIDIHLRGDVEDVTSAVSSKEITKQETKPVPPTELPLYKDFVLKQSDYLKGMLSSGELRERYNISKPTLIKRVKALQISPVKVVNGKYYYSEEQVTVLDTMDHLSKDGWTMGSILNLVRDTRSDD